MFTRQNAVLSALLRAQGFLGDNEAQTNSIDLTGARRRLDAIIASFTTHAVGQSANDRDVKGEIAKQHQLRLMLATDVMRPIAEIARRDLRTVPEFKALRMSRQRATGPAYVASAKGMAEAAAKHKDTLVERGMPADFLDHVQSVLATLELSVSDGAKSRTARIGATKALVVEEQEGRSVLKVLDALVRRALRGNTALLGTWEGARAIHRRPGGPASTATTPSITPANTPESPVTNAA